MPVDGVVEKVDLFFSAKSLANLSTFGTTDAFAVLYTLEKDTADRWIPLGNTGVIKDSLNPDWPKEISVDYLFESPQLLKVKVYDHNRKAHLAEVTQHKFLGEVTFLLANLMTARDQRIALDIYDGQKKLNENGTWTVVFQSIWIDNNLSPRWNPEKVSVIKICNGDLDRPLRIEILDHESSGKHKSMGVVETSLRSLVGSVGVAVNVIEEEKKSKKGYVNSGTLTTISAFIEHHPTFAQFVAGGCEISLIVAIDFTGSNGDPVDPSSLHFVNPMPTPVGTVSTRGLNEYQQAILSVGNILEVYDTDKMYPVYGFGAKVTLPDGSYSPCQHAFPIYPGGLQVHGITGILDAYKECVNKILFSGPTLFAPIINSSAQLAVEDGCSQARQKYTILLIITDGEINDLEQTKAAVIAASHTPLSIIIVGVGNENFDSMEALDSDKELLSAGGKTASRDIVQFVPFRKFHNDGLSALASEVLAEVPSQLLKFMEHQNILPNPPRR
eukprot:gene10276-13818_t